MPFSDETGQRARTSAKGKPKRKIPFWMNVAIALVAPFMCTHSNAIVLCRGESQHPLTDACLVSFALGIRASRLAPGRANNIRNWEEHSTEGTEEFKSVLLGELRANWLRIWRMA